MSFTRFEQGPWRLSHLGESYVYFAQCDFGGPIKIGSSSRPPARVAALAPDFPFTLVLISFTSGNRVTEKFLHCYFRECHLRGEWFAPTPELWRTVFEARTTGRIHFLPPRFPEGCTIELPAHRDVWGVTTAEIAAAMGCGRGYVEKLLENNQTANYKLIAAISAALVRKGKSGDLQPWIVSRTASLETDDEAAA